MVTLEAILKEAKLVQEERLTLDRASRKLKEREDELKATAITQMQAIGLTRLELDGLSAYLDEKDSPYIADYSALEQYIWEQQATDLLQKRLTESAVKLRWADNIEVPGVGVKHEYKLTIK